MKFKLDFEIKPPQQLLSIKDKMLLMGSCFAENISEKLAQHQFKTTTNPNGILFNPLSIIEAIQSYVDAKSYAEKDLFQHNELWYSWQHHGQFADTDLQEALKKITAAQKQGERTLKESNYIIITFGSAWIYELRNTSKVVANCHKVPQAQFNKRLLNEQEIVYAFEQLIQHDLMKNKKFIMTVSPVRYVRDGLTENNQSKSVLISTVHHLCSLYSNIYYFPAYEIVIDELRDYRFYGNDFVHPNQLAIDYIWERFCEVLLDKETKSVIEVIRELNNARLHKAFNAHTQAHQQFKVKYLEKVAALKKQYPFIDLSGYEAFFTA